MSNSKDAGVLITAAVTRAQSNGGRNNAGFRLACDCRKAGFSQEETLALSDEWVRRVNQAVPGDHPYLQKEFEYSVRSAFKSRKSKRTQPQQ